jgi:hypothetical protein
LHRRQGLLAFALLALGFAGGSAAMALGIMTFGEDED